MRTGLWIPAEIEALPLNPTEKFIMSEIVSLDRVGECFASNEHFSKLLGIRTDSVSRIISKLKKQGYLKQTGFDGRKRILLPIIPTNSPTKIEPNLTPILAQTKTQNREPSNARVRESAEAAYAKVPSSINRVQLNTKVQNYWDEFQKWSRGKVSPGTWSIISGLKDPTELTGHGLIFWEKWKNNHILS